MIVCKWGLVWTATSTVWSIVPSKSVLIWSVAIHGTSDLKPFPQDVRIEIFPNAIQKDSATDLTTQVGDEVVSKEKKDQLDEGANGSGSFNQGAIQGLSMVISAMQHLLSTCINFITNTTDSVSRSLWWMTCGVAPESGLRKSLMETIVHQG